VAATLRVEIIGHGDLLHGLNPSLKFAVAQDEDQSIRRNLFTEEQIMGSLKEHQVGVSVVDLCRKHGVSDASIYKWKARSAGWTSRRPSG